MTLLTLVLRMPSVLILLLPPLLGSPSGTRMMFRIWLIVFQIIPIFGTDGSREAIPHLDVEIAGAGAFVHSPAIIFDSHHWGHAQDLDDPHEGSSHIFSVFLAQFNLSKELNIGCYSCFTKLILVFTLALII